MKKVIITILSLALSSLSLISACAFTEDSLAPEGAGLLYMYTSDVRSAISISSKTATCKSTIVASNSVTKIVVTQKLQRKSGDEWTTVTTWSKTSTISTVVFKNTKSSLSAGTYRTRTVAKIYKGSDYETVSANSVTAKVS